jgi:hypothetical protein
MTLRNAFEDLGTEAMLRKILRAVTFPRDTSERLQVVISNQPTVSINGGNVGTALTGQFVAPYQVQTWNLHDIRDEYREMTHQSFQSTRSRWTIT